MAEAITIACPECEKKLAVAAATVGKKIRCKGCEHVFVVKAPAAAKGGGKAPAAKPAAKAVDVKKKAAPEAKTPKPKPPDDDEEDSKPYGITSVDTTPRCPECANELESEDAVLCLTCGYNTRTRVRVETKAVEDVTGMMVFLWLLPGILCVLLTLTLLTFDIFYTIKIFEYVEGAGYEFISYPWFVIWFVWAPTVFLMVGATTFAVRRLILHPRPPERIKKKAKQEDD